MAIATNKPSYFARDILRALEMDHLFSEVLGPNDVERPKPDPEMLEIIMMRIGLAPDEGAYVGELDTTLLSVASSPRMSIWRLRSPGNRARHDQDHPVDERGRTRSWNQSGAARATSSIEQALSVDSANGTPAAAAAFAAWTSPRRA